MTNVLHDIAGLRWSRGIDAAIAALAAMQHGVVARWQLKLVGVTDDAIDFRFSRGRLHRAARGVYAVGQPVVSREGRRMASVLTFGGHAVLSHRAAAAHWALLPSQALEVTVPRTLRTRTGIVVHCL